MILGGGSSATIDKLSSSDESFMKLDGFIFLGEVSGRIEGEVFELEGLMRSSEEC